MTVVVFFDVVNIKEGVVTCRNNKDWRLKNDTTLMK